MEDWVKLNGFLQNLWIQSGWAHEAIKKIALKKHIGTECLEVFSARYLDIHIYWSARKKERMPEAEKHRKCVHELVLSDTHMKMPFHTYILSVCTLAFVLHRKCFSL